VSNAAATDRDAGARHCVNHPSVETWVSCSDCGRPICPDCMVQSAVGIKCRDCARLPRSARVTLRPDRALRAAAAAALAGTGIGVLLAYGIGLGVGFLSLLIAWGVGLLMGRLVLRASGYYRDRTTGWIAVGGAVWAYLLPSIIIAAANGVQLWITLNLLGLAVAAFFAFREAT
jgi:hypothetical protein